MAYMLASPESTTASSSKMVGLDLATRHERHRSVSEDLLTTPRNFDIASPSTNRYHTFSSSSSSGSAKSTNGPSQFTPNGSSTKGGDDLLMTPVLPSPMSTDLWNSKASTSNATERPAPNPTLQINEAPMISESQQDLPMDSDIGLRSPCAGLLAKRRKLRDMTRRTESFNSDSNSCDTPTMDNSPHDLTTRKNSNNYGELESSRRLHPNHLSPRLKPLDQLSPRIRHLDQHQQSPRSSLMDQLSPRPRTYESLSPRLRIMDQLSPRYKLMEQLSPTTRIIATDPTTSMDRAYGDFKKPSMFQNNSEVNDIPAHYTPSPLAVPSPNWSVIDSYIGKEIIRTPKNLDTPSVFNFFGYPPNTPRSAKLFRDLSPNRVLDYYPPMKEVLSPRLPIPDTPTDLSSKAAAPSDLMVEVNEAEDLSTKSKPQQSHPPSPPPTPPPQAPSYPNVKIDYATSLSHLGMPSTKQGSSKLDHMVGCKPDMNGSVYGQRQNVAQLFMGQGSYQIYPSSDNRHLSGDSPPPPSLAYGSGSSRTHCQPSSSWSTHNSHTSGGAVGIVSSNERDLLSVRVKEEPCPSPQPSSPTSSTMSVAKEPIARQRKRAGRKPSSNPAAEAKKSHKKEAKKTNKDLSNASKRVYVCPHCQRSYDWNYNLNRHLKYECGKENAFQCSKCGRKFPHKQNCVYHLKRKHKVVCETNDLYITEGLVIFKGAGNPDDLLDMK